MSIRLTKNTINELTIQPHLVSIPNYRSFFYTFHTVEPIDIGRLNEDYIESTECIQSDFILLTSDRFPTTPLSSYLTNIKRYIDMYLHLMKGMKLLDTAHIVHLDICLKNIIIKDGTLPLLKGFERATMDVSIKNMLVSPIECRTIMHIVNHRLSSLSRQTIEEITDEADEIEFLTPYINKPKQYIIDSLLKWSSTWNVYSLNHLFLDLLDLTNLTNAFTIQWREILKTRRSPDDCIKETTQLMLSAELADLTATPLFGGLSSNTLL